MLFGISTKKKLIKLILDASKSFATEFKNDAEKSRATFETVTEEEYSEIYSSIRRKYFDNVAGAVISTIKASSIRYYDKIQSVFKNPRSFSWIGIYPAEMIENELSAGFLYSICYFAIKNKGAETYDASFLSHMQVDIMNQALSEIGQ